MGTSLAAALAAHLVLLAAQPTGAAEEGPRAPAAASPPAAEEPHAPTSALIGSVELRLEKDADVAGLEALITLRPGAPLSKRDVRRTLERLFGTGRFSDVVMSSSPLPDGRLAVIIEAEGRTFIDRIDFEGHKVLDEAQLLKALAITGRQLEYYPEFAQTLTGRLREAYRRIGYTRARIDHLLLETELKEKVLTFHIDEGEPTKLRAIHVAGDPQLSIAEIQKTLGLAPGDVLDVAKLETGLAALKKRYRAEAYYRARVGTPQVSEDETGAILQLPITAGPAVEFRFQGNDAFSDAELLQRLAYDPEEPLDETLLTHLSERIALFYRLSGFADAKIRVAEVRGSDRKLNFIVFHVVEGAPLRVKSVEVRGARHFSERFIKDRLAESLEEAAVDAAPEPARPNELFAGGPQSRRARTAPEPGTVWYEPAYQQALLRVIRLYESDGFLSARAEPPLVSRDERTREAHVVLTFHEGPQTFVAGLSCPGAPDPSAACGAVPLKAGQPYNSLEVETSRQAIQRTLERAGHAFAVVEDEQDLSDDQRQVTIAFHVTPGPQVKVGRILTQGLDRTAESVVRGSLSVEEGKPLDPAELAQSQRNLLRLGIFKTATLRMNAPEVAEETKDLFVTVEERPTQSISLGPGYSLVDGPRLGVEYTKLNLFGRALQFSGRAKLNYFNLGYYALSGATPPRDGWQALGRRINLSLQDPRVVNLLPVEAGLRLDLVHEFVNRPAYDFQRSAAMVAADLAGGGGLSAGLVADVESVQINQIPGASKNDPTHTDIERLRFGQGTISLLSLSPSVSWDLRDDPANPRRGILLHATGELVTPIQSDLTSPDGTRTSASLFVKASVKANGYLPLWGRMVLAVSLQAGKVFKPDPKSETIVPKRFFLGGANSIRGFMEDGMIAEDQRAFRHECIADPNLPGCSNTSQTGLSEGGELFMLGRVELRFPVSGQFEGALFFDTGNLWLDQTKFNPLRLRYAAGAGVRLVTPIGPAALDLGFNLAPDQVLSEAVFVPHFSIGLF